jgi:hypothetical protein
MVGCPSIFNEHNYLRFVVDLFVLEMIGTFSPTVSKDQSKSDAKLGESPTT